jgi:hypothetical protein
LKNGRRPDRAVFVSDDRLDPRNGQGLAGIDALDGSVSNGGGFEGAVELAAGEAVAGIIHLSGHDQIGMLVMDIGITYHV